MKAPIGTHPDVDDLGDEDVQDEEVTALAELAGAEEEDVDGLEEEDVDEDEDEEDIVDVEASWTDLLWVGVVLFLLWLLGRSGDDGDDLPGGGEPEEWGTP